MDEYLDFLKEVRRALGAKSCAYWVGPNVVLTLTGEKPYGDLVYWSENESDLKLWKSEIERSLQILASHTKLSFGSAEIKEVRKGEVCLTADIITKTSIERTLKESNLFDKGKILALDKIQDIDKFLESLRKNLRNEIKEKFSEENLNHVVSGIILGYPETAIIGMAEVWEGEDSDSHNETMIAHANIEFADFYSCPQPIFDYPEAMKEAHDIQQTNKRWSKILSDFYESDFHKELARNKDFQRKIQELSD